MLSQANQGNMSSVLLLDRMTSAYKSHSTGTQISDTYYISIY